MTIEQRIEPAALRPLGRSGPLSGFLFTLLGAIALLWPAYVNGGPFWFPDTSNYIRAADAAVVFLTGSPSEWSDRLDINEAAAPSNQESVADAGGTSVQPPVQPTRPVLVGRSIYYGTLLYLPMRLLGPWGAVFLQALLVAAILIYAAGPIRRELARQGWSFPLLLVPVLFLATPLPFYASMLMPDIFTGLLVLCLAIVIVLWKRLDRRNRTIFLIICAAIATFHTTNLLIAASMGLIAAIFKLGGSGRLRPVLITLPVIIAGGLSVLVFNLAVTQALQQSPVSPPFLSARITDAGPGTDYLRERCGDPDIDFVLCRYQERLPVHSDSFLWDERPSTGVYQVFSDAERVQVSREDAPFFVAVMAHDPLAFTGASLRSFGEQLVDFDMEGFNLTRAEYRELPDKYPSAIAREIENTLAARDAFPLLPVSLSTAAVSLLSLVIIMAAWLADRRYAAHSRSSLWSWAALVLAGVLANSAICGALSGPHGRYQMRLIWLLPLVAAAVFPLLPRFRDRPQKIGTER